MKLTLTALIPFPGCSSNFSTKDDPEVEASALLAACEAAAETSPAWADFTVTPPSQKFTEVGPMMPYLESIYTINQMVQVQHKTPAPFVRA